MLTSAAIVKLHLRLPSGSIPDDELILLYMAAAETSIENYLDNDGDIQGRADSPPDVPAPIQAAFLIMVGDLYENRNSSEKKIEDNPTLVRLLFPYRQKLGV